jgi:S-adenosylmethionine:tRNA ribosyltransferase-isomerase
VPEAQIAQHPVDFRDDARLMVVNRESGSIEHHHFRDLANFFVPRDLLVINNTKVFPARMWGNKEKTGALIEVFLLRELNAESRLWDVLVDPARKIRIGNKLYFGDDDSLVAEVIDNTTSRGRTLRFLFDGSYEEFRLKLKEMGETPLPKYITRPLEPEDAERYQSIFAKVEGAVAAPVASLHFSKNLMKKLEIKGVDTVEMTMHVGLGTFRQVEVEDLSKHKMESEQYWIYPETAERVNQAKAEKRKVCAVGTSVIRSLESSTITDHRIKSGNGWTSKFIFPPHEFLVANSLITNFHAPQSTMLMLTAAFAGYELTMDVYHTAVKENYRFLSYGDALMFI